MGKLKIFVAAVIILLIVPVYARAASSADVYLPQDQIVEGNYYRAGSTVEVAGKVASDVVVVGGNIIISGEVGGDVIALGGNVRITGPVAGNVRVVAGTVELAGPVGKNVSLAAGTVHITSGSRIAGHLTLAASTLEHRGVVVGSTQGWASKVIIDGTLEGPVELTLDRQGVLQLRDTAITKGSFIYHARQEAQVAKGAQLAEPLQLLPWSAPTSQRSSGWWFGQLVSLFGWLVIGLVLVVLVPKLLDQLTTTAVTNPWRRLGWGLVWLVVPPVVMILLAVTVIGLPLAAIAAVIYVVGLYLTKVLAGITLAEWLKTRPALAKLAKAPMLLRATIGLVVFKLITLIPVVGWLISLVAMLWLWGSLIEVKRQLLKSFR